MGVVAPLERLTTLRALRDLHPTLGYEGVVELVRIGRQHVLEQTDRGVGAFGQPRVEREDLVVSGEEGLVEALVVGVTLFDVAQVPLTVKCGGIAGVGEYFGDGYFFARASHASRAAYRCCTCRCGQRDGR